MSEKDFSIDKKHVVDVMDFNNCDEVLVTSSGLVYLKHAESFCKSECVRTGTQYKTVTREEVASGSTDGKPLGKMNVAELKAFAEENNIEVDGTKAEMVAAIEAELVKREEGGSGE